MTSADTTSTKAGNKASLSEDQILDYLTNHPEFLDRHYPSFQGGADRQLIDVTGSIARKARDEARRLSEANKTLIDAAAANMMHWQALHHATLGFLACTDLTSFARMVDEELPVIFSLAGARLIMPSSHAIAEAEELGFLCLPIDEISDILNAKHIYLGPSRGSGLFSAPSASMAAIALPDQLPYPVKGSALILAGRSADSFSPEQGQTLLTYLAQIVGVCLLARLEGG